MPPVGKGMLSYQSDGAIFTLLQVTAQNGSTGKIILASGKVF